MLKSKEEKTKITSERLDLEEFNLLKRKLRNKISSPKKDKDTIIDYKKINPTRYLVKVKTSKSFWLVFSESFHEGWKAYVRKKAKNREKKKRGVVVFWLLFLSFLSEGVAAVESDTYGCGNSDCDGCTVGHGSSSAST